MVFVNFVHNVIDFVHDYNFISNFLFNMYSAFCILVTTKPHCIYDYPFLRFFTLLLQLIVKINSFLPAPVSLF